MELKDLFDIEKTIAKDFLQNENEPWNCLPKIHDYILEIGSMLDKEKFEQKDENVWIAKTAKVAPTACIIGPVIIDENAEIRHCAFIRGEAIIGKGSIVGNSTEIKNAILFDEVEVPHFNYIGDSILGYKAHMGAGSITSNIKSDRTNVVINSELETNLMKVGAFLGDGAEIGCNCVLNPGTIIGKSTIVYPLSSVRGIIPPNSIYKKQDDITLRRYI